MSASAAIRSGDLDGVRVLVVEDERAIASGIRRLLSRVGADVTIVRTLEAAHRSITELDWDLVLLDQHLPDGDGLDLLGTISALSVRPALIAVSAHLQTARRALTLQAARAILLPKPFDRDELLIAALDAIALASGSGQAVSEVRKRGDGDSPSLEFGPIGVNLVTQTVTVDGAPVDVQPAQFRILVQLLSRIGTAVPYEELTGGAVRGSHDDSSIRFQIHVLRRRLGHAGKLIETARNGYGIALGPDASRSATTPREDALETDPAISKR
ncbi:MAG TPA: response regulator transcription factor [Polyangiaceae bacterium]|nr:response regulator transcription factor [Polyangiaceae bacterium]